MDVKCLITSSPLEEEWCVWN